jgi:CDP-2,3-bis-(O-geranylgeranyl)-sn-glycerol synthase
MANAAILLGLLCVANGVPLLLRLVLGQRLAAPLDAGLTLPDGHPLFGRTKTLRGVVASVGGTACAAWLVGLQPLMGTGIAAAAMAGDLVSSFIKRRLRLRPSHDMPGLDQIPESLLPALLYRDALEVSGPALGVVLAVFLVTDLLATAALHRWNRHEKGSRLAL